MFWRSLLECYSEISVPIIKAKFGKNIFEETKLKAIKLDESGKGERKFKFSNGSQELISFIYCHLDDELLKQYKAKKDPIPKITLYISEKVKVYDQKIEFCDDKICKVKTRVPFNYFAIITTSKKRWFSLTFFTAF